MRQIEIMNKTADIEKKGFYNKKKDTIYVFEKSKLHADVRGIIRGVFYEREEDLTECYIVESTVTLYDGIGTQLALV